MDKLDAIFSPEPIAVIGASTQKSKVGHPWTSMDMSENSGLKLPDIIITLAPPVAPAA